MTLVELLVVLAILALMATVAITSTDVLMSQGRYEATVRTLTSIEEAVLGASDRRQADGTPLIGGFVADVGRLPVMVGSDPTTQLAELWDPTLWSSYLFQLRAGPAGPPDYSDIQLPCGWRGPYLRLGMGVADVRDGWRQPFLVTPTTSGALLQSITWVPVAPYTTPLVVPRTGDFAASAGGALVTVSGPVTNNGAPPTSETVVLLCPDPAQPTLKVMPDEEPSPGAFKFTNVPIGLRAIRAVIDGKTIAKYVYVPSDGLTLALNYTP